MAARFLIEVESVSGLRRRVAVQPYQNCSAAETELLNAMGGETIDGGESQTLYFEDAKGRALPRDDDITLRDYFSGSVVEAGDILEEQEVKLFVKHRRYEQSDTQN